VSVPRSRRKSRGGLLEEEHDWAEDIARIARWAHMAAHCLPMGRACSSIAMQGRSHTGAKAPRWASSFRRAGGKRISVLRT